MSLLGLGKAEWLYRVYSKSEEFTEELVGIAGESIGE